MKVSESSRIKRIGIDILGILAIIAAGITAPIPGPGGLPLLIIGLSLLATNHDWAENLLDHVKKQGTNLGKRVFSDRPIIILLLDVLSIVFITAAVILVTHVTKSIARTAAISLISTGLLLFFGNHQRWQRLKAQLRKHK